MRLRVVYTAQLRTAAGVDGDDVELRDGGTLFDLFQRLAVQRAQAAAHLVTEAGEVRASLLVVLNDAAVPVRRASAVALSSGDTITLLSPIAGG